jgi:hypothetical protein
MLNINFFDVENAKTSMFDTVYYGFHKVLLTLLREYFNIVHILLICPII